MRIKKVYETIINLTACEMYQDIDTVIMTYLKKFFEGKCRENSFVIEIEKIIKRSACMMAKSRLDGSGDVNVQFQAQALIYNKDDILPCCEILRTEKAQQIICKYGDNTVILVRGMNIFQSLKPGQFIGILIREVSYLRERDKITIYGIPYTYPRDFTIYGINEPADNMSDEDRAILNMKQADVFEEMSKINNLDKQIREKLAAIYYPYKKKPAVTDWPTGAKIMEIVAAQTVSKDQWICRPPQLPKENAEILVLSAKTLGALPDLSGNSWFATATIVVEKPIRALMALLDDYLKYLQFLREMSEYFNTEERFTSHNNIWLIYQHIKQ
jgi:hypothetical protein